MADRPRYIARWANGQSTSLHAVEPGSRTTVCGEPLRRRTVSDDVPWPSDHPHACA